MKTIKFCTRCQTKKSISFFSKSRRRKDGYADWCKSCTSEYKRIYYQKNIESEKQKRHNHYIETKDAYIKRARKFQLSHATERQVYMKDYHQNTKERDRDKRLRYNAQWIKTPKGVAFNRIRGHLRRAAGKLSPSEWLSILQEFNGSCAYCIKKTEDLQIEHIVPVSKGGLTTVENVVPACPSCNKKKRNKSILEFVGEFRYVSG